jgi:hypothetical protein
MQINAGAQTQTQRRGTIRGLARCTLADDQHMHTTICRQQSGLDPSSETDWKAARDGFGIAKAIDGR